MMRKGGTGLTDGWIDRTELLLPPPPPPPPPPQSPPTITTITTTTTTNITTITRAQLRSKFTFDACSREVTLVTWSV
ncbi:unnamed protein product [Brugia pahangi]|uniref:Uncharacterized protein n=1 Tax=Brugia pahangi TaxID=6280 RepID=A0A0N4SWT7_BRUPA|nr:unnamed protein product [Brugia pahangi]